jgi:N6-L-threonylcarbamoyladenine synthase
MKYILGIDTSCYTTSMACVSLDGKIIFDRQLLLDVPQGERGLMQSEALFQHLRNLPLITKAIQESLPHGTMAAVCASVRPRPIEDSYMPVFMFSHHIGLAISNLHRIPFYPVSHQENHIMAGLSTANGPNSSRFLALHLSGGTSELLSVEALSAGFDIEIVGNTLDLPAGQFVDRIGVALGLPFPAGPHLEALSASGSGAVTLTGSVRGLNVSFSGPESQARRFIQEGAPHAEVAYAVYDLLIRTTCKWLLHAVEAGCPKEVLMAGGVSSSKRLRQGLKERLLKRNKTIQLYFADPRLSKDNAVGTALLGVQAFHRDTDK